MPVHLRENRWQDDRPWEVRHPRWAALAEVCLLVGSGFLFWLLVVTESGRPL